MTYVAYACVWGCEKRVAVLDGDHNHWVRENQGVRQGFEKPKHHKFFIGQIDRKVL